MKGGRRFSFTALVVIGDGNGRVGLGYGKAKEVPLAIQKGTEEAKQFIFNVPLAGSTITHPSSARLGAGVCCSSRLRPVPASSPAARREPFSKKPGIHDVLCKSLGSSNTINVARATIAGLRALKRPDDVATFRGLSPENSFLAACWAAYSTPERARRPCPHRGCMMANFRSPRSVR